MSDYLPHGTKHPRHSLGIAAGTLDGLLDAPSGGGLGIGGCMDETGKRLSRSLAFGGVLIWKSVNGIHDNWGFVVLRLKGRRIIA